MACEPPRILIITRGSREDLQRNPRMLGDVVGVRNWPNEAYLMKWTKAVAVCGGARVSFATCAPGSSQYASKWITADRQISL